MASIRDLADQYGLRGSGSLRSIEPPPRADLPVIDNGNPVDPRLNVTTSVDCYISGQYIGPKGRRLDITQRYTIYVRYSAETWSQTMEQVRARIAADFAAKYSQFTMSAVFVPDLPGAPSGGDAPVGFYFGREEWQRRFRRASFDVDTELLKADANISSIEMRYRDWVRGAVVRSSGRDRRYRYGG